MFSNRFLNRCRLLILPPIAVGILILLWMTVGKQPPENVPGFTVFWWMHRNCGSYSEKTVPVNSGATVLPENA
jgi:hypothetical protein